MLLSARALASYANVNSFEISTQISFTMGDSGTIYFQLIDATVDRLLNPTGRRYVPAAGATLMVTFTSLNAANIIVRSASQPAACGDGSIWSVPLLSSDPLDGTVSMQLQLTEGSKVTNGFVQGFLRVSNGSVNQGGC